MTTAKQKISKKAPAVKPKAKGQKGAGVGKAKTKIATQKKNLEVKEKKKRPLTLKQRKLVQGIAEGKTQKQAALDAGYKAKHVESATSHELKKAQVKATLQDLMEHMGLSDGALLIKHRELLNAQKQISGVKDADGGSVEFIEVPDHPVQAKALEMAYKLKGAFVEKKEVSFPQGLALEVVFGK